MEWFVTQQQKPQKPENENNLPTRYIEWSEEISLTVLWREIKLGYITWDKTLGSWKVGKRYCVLKNREILVNLHISMLEKERGNYIPLSSCLNYRSFFPGERSKNNFSEGLVSARTVKTSVLHLLDNLKALTSSSWTRWPLGVLPSLWFSRKKSFLFLNYFSDGLTRALNIILTHYGCF